jgi:RNA polymerase sigma factor (sigma-70 family)
MMEINDKIEAGLKDEEHQKIMNKASSSFTNQLTLDEIRTCHMNALWKAHEHYNPDGGAKFFTYLYRGVVIECLRELRFNQRHKDHKSLHANIPDKRDSHFYLELKEELEQMPNKEMLKDRLSGLSIKEISEKFGYNRETARRKIKKSMSRLASKME